MRLYLQCDMLGSSVATLVRLVFNCSLLPCRGLILLNIMTFVMGTNWVVVKESNSAFDPVRIGAAQYIGVLCVNTETHMNNKNSSVSYV